MHQDSEMILRPPVEEILAASTDPDSVWLWCLYCERFFQARHLRVDYLGNRQGCAFCQCAGFDCAIFRWDTFRNDEEGWPRSEADLRHGLRLGQEPAVGTGSGHRAGRFDRQSAKRSTTPS